MNSAKRAMLYTLRKRGKTLSLFLLIFITAVFLLTCFGVLNASESIAMEIRTSIGAAFYIRAKTAVSVNENGGAEVKGNNVHISEKEIDEIMQTGEIRYCNPINYGFAKGDSIRFIPGEKYTDESSMGKVTSVRYSALTPDFMEEKANLTEGSHITENDNGKILISEQLAKLNHLSVGDVITLTHARLGEHDGAYIDEIHVKTAFVEVEIAGIYRLTAEDTAPKPTAGVPENGIYASIDVLDSLHESDTGVYTGEVDFFISDPEQLENITRKVQLLPSIDWNTHFIRTNDFQYSKIADGLQSLGNLMIILLVCVSIVSTAVLILMLTMRTHARTRETGILLAAGISKRQILAQFLLEVLSVAAFAMILAYFTSVGIAKVLDSSLFVDLQPNLLNEGTLTSSQAINYLSLNGLQLSLIYLYQIIVITASTVVSSVMLMRLKPKEILSKLS